MFKPSLVRVKSTSPKPSIDTLFIATSDGKESDGSTTGLYGFKPELAELNQGWKEKLDIPVNKKKSHILTQYFDYGRSIERKVKRKVAANNSEADYLTQSGWFNKPTPASAEESIDHYTNNITIYGIHLIWVS